MTDTFLLRLQTLIKGEYNEKGRGMELSELIHYNNMLLTCDDRTGIGTPRNKF